ncbi:MAG: hypothetical protein K2I75_06540, partial [Clostridiales bacterium]|nr:hypothetical protein [Clostridiales bacterium]
LTAFQAFDGEHFELTDNASLNATVVNYFNGLGFGKYYFAVFVPDADNYTYLFYTGSFNVSQTGNYWKNATPPDISGWTYGEFSENLFRNGEPLHGSTEYTVYTVVGGNPDEVVEIDGNPLSGKSYDELKAMLNGLNADTYIIQATSGSTNEYTAATWSKQFVVTKADNEWETNPSIDGWTYGGTPATPDNGTVQYESTEATITGQYYPTTTDGNGNLIADTTKTPLAAVTNAGSYAYVVTVADTTNYNGFTTTLFFSVAKADNDWTTSPAGSYSWAWGDDISTLTSNIVNAAVTNGTVSFDIVKIGGGAIPTGTISEILEALAVGEYTITFTVAENNNYADVLSAIAYVTVGNAQLTVNTEPACAGWTWGVDDANKVFTNIAVTSAKEDDVVTVQYRVSANGGDTWTNYLNTHTALMDNIKVRAAGDYVVEVTASCANHDSVTRTVSFTIGNASLTWSDEPSNVEWEWNGSWTEADGDRDIPNLTAKGCNNVDATLSYTINGTAYADFDAVESYLQSATLAAGTYTVKVSATLANHDSDEKTFTVTVNVAQNEWIDEPEDSYEMVYNEWATLPATTAKFGTVVYTCGSEPVTNVNDWIKTRNAQTYVLTLSVAGVTNQYGALTKDVTIIVKSAGSQWDNQNALSEDNEETYTAVYGTAAHSALKDTIVFPVRVSGGTTTYSVFVNGGDTAVAEYVTLAGIQSYFTSALTAGTYVIKAEFVPTSDSFSTLTYIITVVVNKAEVDWVSGHKLEQGDPQTYKSVVLPDPEADKDFATVTVTVKNNNGETLDMGGKSLSEFVADLGAGIYTVTATIADSDNYVIVGDKTTTIALYITAIQNAWSDVTEGDTTITAQQWTDGYTWTFTRGDTISVIAPEAVIGETAITFDGISFATVAALNEYLNGRNLANDSGYALVFSVVGTDDYTGLVSNCVVVINKKSNAWQQELESVTASGSIDADEFTMPTADVYQVEVDGKLVDLRLFNVVKAGARPNSNWYTAQEFLDEQLGELANGTYTVTVNIGGDAHGITDADFTAALAKYNADYNAISSSCTVTLTP